MVVTVFVLRYVVCSVICGIACYILCGYVCVLRSRGSEERNVLAGVSEGSD